MPRRSLLLGSIRGRLRLATAGIATILIAAATVGVLTLQRLSRDTQRSETAEARVQDLTARFALDVADELRAGDEYLHTPDSALAHMFRARGRDAHRVQAVLVRLQGTATPRANASDAELLARIDAELSDLESVYTRAHRLVDVGASAAAARIVAGAATLESQLRDNVTVLDKNQTTRVTQFSGSVRREAIASSAVLMALLIGAVCLVALLTWQLGASIARPLAVLVSHANALQQGSRDRHTSPDGMPAEFRVLANAMNQATDSLASLARTEDALHQSEKLAAIGTLISGVAHELNNPLQTVLFTTELIKANSSDPTLRMELSTIGEQVLRARAIISDLLKTVRADTVMRDAAPLDVTLQDMRRELSIIADRYGSTVEVVVHGPLPPLLVERVGFVQVITNLVANAGAAAGTGGRVRVTAQRSNGGAEILVDDSGPGIRPELLGRIFEPFFSTKPVGKGTGLGLSVSRGIIKSMGGTLTAQSHWGGELTGARFRLFIPVGRQSPSDTMATTEQAVPAPPSAPPPSRQPTLAPKAEVERTGVGRMLVVEDELPIQAVLSRLFRTRGWWVDVASNGAEALSRINGSLAEGSAYTVILCDLRMPVLSGMEVHDVLQREQPALLERLVFLTGDIVGEEVRTFVDRTTCRILTKPLDIANLEQVVASVARTAGVAVGPPAETGAWRASA